MTEKWIVVNVGCMECGVTTQIVGVFTKKEIAEKWANKLNLTHGWRQHGENVFEIFPFPKLDEVREEYKVPAPQQEDDAPRGLYPNT